MVYKRDNNSSGDEGGDIVARHFPTLKTLSTWNNELGWEVAATVADVLTGLGAFDISLNREVMHGAGFLGKLPYLKELSASI